ncbi:MAG TPA: TrkA C-terminal domain-containing protein, partial [Candidatus Hydrogenedentes bacterium]|nr:TrkA C-terminal domain-containing protein [Candidatus Hydrogenedentota bacterium]
TLITAVAGIGSPIAFRPIKTLDFPKDTLVGAIRRGHETLTPRGDTEIYPGDELILLTTRNREAEAREWLRRNT